MLVSPYLDIWIPKIELLGELVGESLSGLVGGGPPLNPRGSMVPNLLSTVPEMLVRN